MIPKNSLDTIGLRRQGDIAKYIPKFQVAKMSLEVAEIRFSNLVLQAIKQVKESPTGKRVRGQREGGAARGR